MQVMPAGNGSKIPLKVRLQRTLKQKPRLLLQPRILCPPQQHAVRSSSSSSSSAARHRHLARSLARRSFHFPRSVDNLMTAVSPDERTNDNERIISPLSPLLSSDAMI